MIYVISDIHQLALNDVIHLCKEYSKLVYEIDTNNVQTDSLYYKETLKQTLKKTKTMISLTEDNLQLFKDRKIVKDYLFDTILSSDFLRIENTVYEIPEEISPQPSFLDFLYKLSTFVAEEVDYDKLETHSPTTSFIICKNVKKEVADILLLEKVLIKNGK